MSAAMEYPQQQQHQQRPRSKSTFSFKSDKSHGSHNKHEKSPEKHHQRVSSKDDTHLHTKADPNAAMNEVQPIAAALEKPTLQSLRSFQHTDTSGQPIAEPDLSNPTRSRWERPLDTIRSFEAAIDNEYRRRAQTMRADQSEIGGYSRRSSYYGGGNGTEQNRYSQPSGGGHYGSRQAAATRESWADNSYGPTGGQRQRYNRMQSDPAYNRYSNGPGGVYPTNGYQQSRDTVNTNGSNGSESAPYSNEPSSDNSSIERGGPVRYPDGEQYGFNGFSGGPQPILEEYGNRPGPANGYNYNGGNMPPPVPAKANPPANNPNMIKLNSNGEGPPPANGGRPNVLSRKSTDASDKRRSWFKRRFSKN